MTILSWWTLSKFNQWTQEEEEGEGLVIVVRSDSINNMITIQYRHQLTPLVLNNRLDITGPVVKTTSKSFDFKYWQTHIKLALQAEAFLKLKSLLLFVYFT